MVKNLELDSPLSLRRLRRTPFIRELVREVRVSPEQMIQPLFVVESLAERQAVPGLTGTYRETSESLLKTIELDLEAGVKKFLLFGVPKSKNLNDFSFSFIASQIQSIRKRFGSDLFLGVDVCLCSATTHGHCGILSSEGDHIDNSITVANIAQAALVFAQAGADCVAPSDMMDGRVKTIRTALDQNGLQQTLIMSYAAKFHSKFYGPFRLAADSAPQSDSALTSLTDRATYQIDPASPKDAVQSALRDAEEGADILMVKPGLPYLDVLSQLSKQIHKPWAVYQVSGEYASIELLAQNGLTNGPLAHVEVWTAFVRAGASIILTYGARYAREYLLKSREQGLC